MEKSPRGGGWAPEVGLVRDDNLRFSEHRHGHPVLRRFRLFPDTLDADALSFPVWDRVHDRVAARLWSGGR